MLGQKISAERLEFERGGGQLLVSRYGGRLWVDIANGCWWADVADGFCNRGGVA